MSSPARYVAHACMAVLTLGAVAALVVSLLTATTPTDVQLRAAAHETAGASSFQELIRFGSGAVPTPRSAFKLSAAGEITYHATDRIAIVQPDGQGGRQIEVAIGNRAWESVDGGRTWEQAPSTGENFGAKAVATLLEVPNAVTAANGVHSDGDVYEYTTTDPALYNASRLTAGVPPGLVTHVHAVVTGSELTELRLLFTSGRSAAEVEYTYVRIGSAPAIPVPASSTP